MIWKVLTQPTPLEKVVIFGEWSLVVTRSHALRTAVFQDTLGSNKRENLVGIVCEFGQCSDGTH
jgi:hypothetical protein